MSTEPCTKWMSDYQSVFYSCGEVISKLTLRWIALALVGIPFYVNPAPSKHYKKETIILRTSNYCKDSKTHALIKKS